MSVRPLSKTLVAAALWVLTPALSSAEVLELLAEKSYEAVLGACPSASSQALGKLDRFVVQCYVQPNVSNTVVHANGDISKIAQEHIFQAAGEKLLAQTKCEAATAKSYAENASLQTDLIAAIRERIPKMNELKAQINELTSSASLLKGSNPSTAFYNPNGLRLSERDQKKKALYDSKQEQIRKLTSQYDALAASFPAGNAEQVHQLIDQLMKTDLKDESAMRKLIRSNYSELSLQEIKDVVRLQKQVASPEGLNRSTREQLVSDEFFMGELFSDYVVHGADPAAVKTLRCDIDKRYGKGADLRNGIAQVTAMVLSGGAMLVQSVGRAAVAATWAARARSVVSATSTRILQAGATTLSSVRLVQDLNDACFPHSVLKTARSGSEQCGDPKREKREAEEASCVLNASLAVIGSGKVQTIGKLAASSKIGARLMETKAFKTLDASAQKLILESLEQREKAIEASAKTLRTSGKTSEVASAHLGLANSSRIAADRVGWAGDLKTARELAAESEKSYAKLAEIKKLEGSQVLDFAQAKIKSGDVKGAEKILKDSFRSDSELADVYRSLRSEVERTNGGAWQAYVRARTIQLMDKLIESRPTLANNALANWVGSASKERARLQSLLRDQTQSLERSGFSAAEYLF